MTPVPPHLKGVIVKLVWADEHFEALHKDILAYLDVCRQVAGFTPTINPEQNFVRISHGQLPEPDWRISLRIGDCVQNTRSTLDHLWKRLRAKGNFPIFADPDEWLKCREGILKGVPAGAHAIIDALQPCGMGKDAPSHPIAVLNKLSRIDKHESFHLTIARTTDARFTFFDADGKVTASFQPDVVFEDDAELVVRDVPPQIAQLGMKVNTKGTFHVTFKNTGPWGNKPVLEVLRRCIDFVRGSVVTPLAPFTK